MELCVELADAPATRRLGGLIAGQLVPGDVILLSGELGTGKTTMTQGLVGALGMSDGVTSPTFALCHHYRTDPVIAHVDCWRLDDPRELVDLALDEVLEDGGVVVVEWGERAAFLFDDEVLSVRLERAEQRRMATLESVAESWQPRLAVLAARWRATEAAQ